jgi:hypothetical protein
VAFYHQLSGYSGGTAQDLHLIPQLLFAPYTITIVLYIYSNAFTTLSIPENLLGQKNLPKPCCYFFPLLDSLSYFIY